MEKLSCKDWFCLGCRILLGLIFIVSATLKLVSLDAFELYIFGFEWFNFGVSTYLARSVILAEYFVGGIFLFTLRNRWIDLICGGLLGGFSLFLIYLIISGKDGNCHCFGDSFVFSPLESLAKNVVLIALYFFALKSKDLNFVFKNKLSILIAIVALIVSFAIRPPYPFGLYKETPLDSDKFVQFLEQDSLSGGLSDGHDLVFFLSTKCKYCKLAAKRLDIILKKHPYPTQNIHLYIWGTDEGVAKFFKENEVTPLPYQLINPITLLDISKGKMPLLLLLENGEVIGKMNNTTFDEGLLVNFLNKK